MFDLSTLVTVAATFVAAEVGLAVIVGRLLARASDAQLAPARGTPGQATDLPVAEPSSPVWN